MSTALTNRDNLRTSRERLPLIEQVAWPRSIPDLIAAVAALPHPIVFDSARFDQTLGRYSFLSATPFEVIRSRDGFVEIAGPNGESIAACAGDPFSTLSERLDRYRLDRGDGPPFQGGAAGLFSYDLCRHVERLPRPRIDEFQIPDLAVGFYDWVIALDHCERRAWVVSTGCPETSARAARRRAFDRLHQAIALLDGCGARAEVPRAIQQTTGKRLQAESLAPQFPLASEHGEISSNFSREHFLDTLRRAIDYIHAGDTYQVNLAQRLLCPLREHPIELYLRLRERNAAPFAAYFDAGDFVIASASPERFLRLRDRAVETRPIKGTRPRWPAPEADMFSAGELCESDKDRAENVMIVDLLRNDLGRVCEFGSVQVTNPLSLESYEFVHHLVSEVRGRLRAECGPIDLLRAAFPGGSVTGAPKIRAMEIIAELEPNARGAYCGSLGYIGFDGSMDTNILIRTFTCSRGWTQFPVGGGIVAESSPEREYEETMHKAEGMIRALT